ncbi:MAG: S-methyl-5-thioribose-1-phosphate isomerase [Verrucomicrobia bacterium]|jgi:methylthioribose-1-phosphate isomerase|nr:S-methyl-5-thioribose-1-phosphate isomerase [Verrucomicrobiota bacterium]MBT7067543.1 S-methyl-5-thioribose-1-phosphate isomerase [Verrucomicrobiota bacterium]MBT7698700.1 S-methyl-5-thioribose-1-phosphate isomerase [Verrucomicrobiota bacterium]
MMKHIRPIDWIPAQPDSIMPGTLHILDQTLLPNETRFVDTTDQAAIWNAIKILQVRGAPAIGVAAAMGVAAAAQAAAGGRRDDVLAAVDFSADYLATSRPTAVNLFWALERMRRHAHASTTTDAAELATELVQEAIAIRDEDLAMCRTIGEHGAALLTDGDTILTHCNAGGLATSGYGTALAPIYVAQEQGKNLHVYADETRPLLQGARLTAWELMQAGIDVTLICDNMAAQVMKEGRIDAVFVGADRIAANGDAANKIGTYGVALLAKAHAIPFYVLAPTSTIDPDAATGDAIPIEERGAEEITEGFGRRTAPAGVKVYAPAFDVTPAELITAIITEDGICRPSTIHV